MATRSSKAQPAVFVLEPSPALTVTIEPSACEGSAPSKSEASGQQGDDVEVHLHPGGQGCWVARMVAVLGAEAMMVCPLGGESGEVLSALIGQESVQVTGIPTAGANAVSLSDRRSGERRKIVSTASATLTRHELDDLYSACLAVAMAAEVAVIAGPAFAPGLPVDLFRRLAADLRELGIPVVADLSGPELEAATEGGVTVLKASDGDLAAAGHAASTELADLIAAGERLLSGKVEHLVISRGEHPALAALDARRWEIGSPLLGEVDHRGAGDSMSAGLAVGIARGYPLTDAVQLGAAAGALNVTRRGFATGRREAIERLTGAVTARQLDNH